MLVYIRSVPIWRPENSVNIWNLLWLSRRLIICTEQTGVYIRTFPNATDNFLKGARSWDKYTFFNKLDRRLVSRTAITQYFKKLWFPNEARYWALKLQTDINLPTLVPDEDKNFRGSLVLDFRKWWRHVKTIYFQNKLRRPDDIYLPGSFHMSWVLAWMLSCWWLKRWELRDSLVDFSQRWQGVIQGIRTRALLWSFMLWANGKAEFFKFENFFDFALWMNNIYFRLLYA